MNRDRGAPAGIAAIPAKYLTTSLILAAIVLAVTSSQCLPNPITAFLSEADSVASLEDQKLLDELVSDNSIIVGAAVGQLLEDACKYRDDGGEEEAQRKLLLAQRIADRHQKLSESSALADLARTYRGWNPDQLAVRQRARSLEEEGGVARGEGDADRAIDLLRQAMALYEEIGDARSVAVLWGSLGVAYWSKADFDSVAVAYERALAARRALEDRILEGKTLNGLGSVNYELGDLDLSAAYYREAIDLRRKTKDVEGLATSLTYLGNTCIAMGRTLDARKALEEALPVVEQTGDKIKLFELLTSTASLNAEMGRGTSSNGQLEEALALAVVIGDPKRQAICRNNLALNYAEAYRYGEALQELAAVEDLLGQHPDPEQSAIYFRNLGITHLRIGELAFARADFDTLYRLSEENRMPVLEMEALLNLGYLLKEMEKPEEGLAYADQARALAETVKNPKMLRESLILAAEIDRTLGDYDGAIEKWTTVLEQDRAQNVDADIAMDRMGIANNEALAGRPEEARQIYRDVAPAVESTDDGDLILSLAFGIGHSFEKTDPDSARFYYESALASVDSIRAEVGASGARTGYLGGVRRSYFEEVATYYAGLATRGTDRWADRAFTTIERAKARGLLDMIEASVLGETSGTEEALLDSIYSLDRGAPDYAAHHERLEARYAASRQTRLASALGNAGAPPEIAGLDDIRRAISDRTAVLAYALGDTMSLAWAITRDGCKVFRLPRRSALAEEVARLRDAMMQPVVMDQSLRESARELYVTLIEPAWPSVGKASELLIVPDGVLFELPFEVLLAEDPPAQADWGQLPCLARSHTITYVPSASTYLALQGRVGKDIYDKDLLAFGDPDYSALGPLSGLRGRLDALPYTRDEVLGLGSMAEKGSSIHLGTDASEAVLKSELKTGSFRVLHLAAHGLIDPAEPSASCIALCPDSGGTENGYFQTLEAITSPMNVGLVVLSACESGRGQIGRGEGVVGLSRAFLASGAGGVVASLWPVPDKATAELMSEFYERMLVKRGPAGRSLNEARLALMNDPKYAHPYYWAAFVLIGLETSPW